MKSFYKLLMLVLLAIPLGLQAQIYFPPNTGTNWETVSPESLNWNVSRIDSLYDFLESKNTKAFIVLKDGKIVLEKYFGTFTVDSNWYWASAAKTLTSMMVGIAQSEGKLSIDDKTSKYIGTGWTSAPIEKENLITIRNQISMTTGLNDKGEDIYCTDKSCLEYLADAGTRWAYYTAPYTLLDSVLESAYGGTKFNLLFSEKIKNKIGMNGVWLKQDYNNVYFSTARSMARFGILLQNRGEWNSEKVLADTAYFNAMTNSSQDINPSYGYLCWLNGKSTYMIPQLQIKFKGKLFEDAPDDVFAALGKNGQCLNVCPSKGIVFVRMGNAPSANQLEVATEFNNEIWKYLNPAMNAPSGIAKEELSQFEIYPNPFTDFITVQNSDGKDKQLKLYNSIGTVLKSVELQTGSNFIEIADLPSGAYFVRIDTGDSIFVKHLIKR